MNERIVSILAEGFVKILVASIKVTIPLTIIGFSLAMIIALVISMNVRYNS